MPDGTATAHLYRPKLATLFAEGYDLAAFRKDVLAGLTVSIVALPLSMAIAVASGTLAAEHILHGQTPAAYLAAARALTAQPIRLASIVSQLAANRAGRALIIGAATLVPGLVAAIARRTRLPAAALPMQDQDDSYAPVRA